MLWGLRAGSPWRDLPPELGNWHNTYTRFSRWGEKGVWQQAVNALSGNADLQALLLDSITGGHVHDITQAPALIAGLQAGQVIADRAFD